MISSLSDVIQLGILLALLVVCNMYSHLLGGLLYALILSLTNVPKLGRLFDFLFAAGGPIKLGILVKIGAWLVSSSGVLLGLGVYLLLFGEPTQAWAFWTILTVSCIAMLNIVFDLLLFRVPQFDESLELMRSIPISSFKSKFNLISSDADALQSLARSHFADMVLPKFFRMLITIGVIYYCLGRVGLVNSAGPNLPTLGESLLFSFSTPALNLVNTTLHLYDGPLWDLVRIVSSFLVFFWLILFVTIASSSISAKPERDDKTLVEDIFPNILQALAAQQQAGVKPVGLHPQDLEAASGQVPPGAVRIIAAMVNPVGADAGNESVTLFNATSKPILLHNWRLEDTSGRQQPVPLMELAAHATTRVRLDARNVRLTNAAGEIRLFDAHNTEVHHVSYLASDAAREGGVVEFSAVAD